MTTQELPKPDYALPAGYEHIHSGKVRDLWTTPHGDLLVVATDRISAYDWILPTPIPDKGAILTALSQWWFERLMNVVPNHVRSLDVPDTVRGRAMVCERLSMFPVECVARGYLTGSGLAEYNEHGTVCGIPLPDELVDGSKLPYPIFTPATKAAFGEHDENVDFHTVADTVGLAAAEVLRDLTIEVYRTAEEIAAKRGVILADTKFEFGARNDGTIVLADEVLTPDSSRYWPAELWNPGTQQPSFDKQFVRDWLTSPAADWDRNGTVPPPPLPDEVVEQTRAKYIEAYERLTGRTWA
jgi:phosphoribosylaminoimidazole-succinocarboxamide synthase